MKRLKTGAAATGRISAPSRDNSRSKEPPPRARAKAPAPDKGTEIFGETVTESDGGGDATARQFLAELSAHWRRHGKAAFDAALAKDPVRYMNLAAQLMTGSGERKRDERRDELIALLAGLGRKD